MTRGARITTGIRAVSLAALLPALWSCAEDPASRPNAVVIMIDTLRADRLGAHGNPDGATPHLDALAIVRDATGNEVLLDGVESIRRTVREGEGIARPMGETGIFDDLVTNMVDVGEETGELDSMLLKVADAYETAVDRQIDALFKFLEPALVVLMAVFVGFIVVALFLPLMEIMSSIG